MELIYADRNHIDQGVISNYDFDLAYGSDENNFSFSMPLSAHCCENGYFLYVEGTEYGGIVDEITVDTSKDSVVYSGRTWHGILEHAIIQPDASFDYFTIEGDGNDVIASLIDRLNLGDLFEAESEYSEIYVQPYQFYRYIDAYNGICMMLYANNGKLKIVHRNSKVILSAVPYINYMEDEQWDSSQLDFKIKRAFRPTNHLVCLGSGNLASRHVIHLFTDENGGIQPYSTTDAPVSNADYILTEQNKKISGFDEVADVYDYGNAQQTENFVRLQTQPPNWRNVFMNYYQQTDSGYESLEYYEHDDFRYELLTSRPNAWSETYKDYYEKSGDAYVSVEAVVTPAVVAYKPQNSKPSDWDKNYKTYFYYWSDGTQHGYRSVAGVSYYSYKVQTEKPSDWSTNYQNYFVRKKKGVYSKIGTLSKVPKWVAKKYYTQFTKYKAPDFDKTRASGIRYYYSYIKTEETSSAPTWQSGRYYQYVEETLKDVPAWANGKYFEKKIDDYADLVEKGIQELEKAWLADSISIDLDTGSEYDIGDFIGATEETTGLNVVRAISKKIIKIESGNITIKYKLGGK